MDDVAPERVRVHLTLTWGPSLRAFVLKLLFAKLSTFGPFYFYTILMSSDPLAAPPDCVDGPA